LRTAITLYIINSEVINMTAVGMIVEYNPFHNGHKWHLNSAKEKTGCSCVIAVMSGNYMQRGEPAMFDKWRRAHMAVLSGADLVIELPVVSAVRSAQFFAEGGVRLLNSLGVVRHLCFGAECADIKKLSDIAIASATPEISSNMKTLMKKGISYAAALAQSINKNCSISQDVIQSPNNILAIEYLKALHKFAPNIQPTVIERKHSNYHDKAIDSPFASATAIRNELLNRAIQWGHIEQAVPVTSLEVIKDILKNNSGPVTSDSLSSIILAKLRTLSLLDIENLPEVSEGLHNKIQECALRAANYEDFLNLVKSKRYPRTRLQRIVIHALLGTTRKALNKFDESGPLYARVLAFNTQGRELLKTINQNAKIPVIIKTTDYLNSKQRSSGILSPLQAMLAIDTIASDIYVLGMPESSSKSGGWDFLRSPVYIPLPRQKQGF